MAIELTPIPSGPSADAYLNVSDARQLAGTLPGFAPLLAKSDDDLAALLYAATLDIDAAMRYQGRKYLPTQIREFPRIAYGDLGLARHLGASIVEVDGSRACLARSDTVIWDWDHTLNAPVVPLNVKIACLYQSQWLLKPQYAARIEAIRSGLYQQQIGTGNEIFNKPVDMVGELTGLGDRAHRLMSKFRIRTGALL